MEWDWLLGYAEDLVALNGPASESDILTAELVLGPLPRELRSFLSEHDGGYVASTFLFGVARR